MVQPKIVLVDMDNQEVNYVYHYNRGVEICYLEYIDNLGFLQI